MDLIKTLKDSQLLDLPLEEGFLLSNRISILSNQKYILIGPRSQTLFHFSNPLKWYFFYKNLFIELKTIGKMK